MEKKKLAILISGQLRFLEQNLDFIKSIFSEFDYSFFITIWEGESESNISLFKKYYRPKMIEFIKPLEKKEYEKKVVYHPLNETYLRKVVKPAVGTFNMFYSIKKCFQNFDKFSRNENIDYHYICRFRTDLRLISSKINLSSILSKNDNKILIPDLYHYYGINDQFSIGNINIMSKYLKIFDYLEEHISKKRFFHNEYINLCFIKKISAKIKYIKFKYVVDKENIQASNFKSTWTINKDEKTNKSENVSFPKTKTKIPLVFKFETWLLKQMFKIRNFKEIYIKKTISKWGTLKGELGL